MRFIDPTTDKDTHKTSKGDWMCGAVQSALEKVILTRVFASCGNFQQDYRNR